MNQTKFLLRLQVLFLICLMLLQNKCADASVEDEEEDEDSEDIDPMSYPKETTRLPDNAVQNANYSLPDGQYTLLQVTKPVVNGNGNIFFRARNYIFGDYTFLPRVNLYMILLRIVLSLTKARNRERRSLSEYKANCVNNEDAPNTNISETSPETIDFNCETEEKSPSSNLDDYKITIAEVDGKEPPESFKDYNMMDASANLTDPESICTFVISQFEESETDKDQLVFRGNPSKCGQFTGVKFDAPFTQPEGVTASCELDGSLGTVVCTPSPALSYSQKKEGIKMTKHLDIKDGDQIRRRRLPSGTGTVDLMTPGNTPASFEGGSSDSILRGSDKSSGLSGGAIAGIIIACAAVLIGGILAALLCRKTSTSTALYTTGTQDNLAIEQKPVYY